MGPKKGGDQPSKKTETKKKEKIIDDKTFGLKNKNKSKTVQNFIKSVENTVKNGGRSAQALFNEEMAMKAEKKRLKEEEAFLASLSNTAKIIKDGNQSDDEGKKHIICEGYKEGFCEYGDKCKFSHDLNLEYNVSYYHILLLYNKYKFN